MRLIALIAGSWIISHVAWASQPAPTRADLAAGFFLDDSRDQVRVGYMIAGDATLAAAPAGRGELILSVPVVHTRTGVLQTEVAGEQLLLPAGARVFRGAFALGIGQSEPLLGWCGRGLRGGEHTRRPGIVCVLDTPDGRATLSGGSDKPGREWSADGIRLSDADLRIDRPEVQVTEASPFGPMRYELRVFSIGKRLVSLQRSIVGPGEEGGGEARSILRHENRAIHDGVARVPFGAVSLELRISEDRRSVMPAWGAPTDTPADAAAIVDENATLEPEPYTFGAVRLDPDSFDLSAGPVGERELLARGQGARRKVLRAQEFAKVQALLAGMTNERVQAGAVFHDVEFFDKNSLGMWTRTATLCGPFDLDTIRGPSVNLRCLAKAAAGDTYGVYLATPSAPWLSGARYVTFAGQNSIQLRFSELDQDPLGSFDILVGVVDISRTWVRIGAAARRGAEEVPFWSARARFSEAGEARFPFWDRVLVVRRAGEKAITAAFEPNGDGAGFYGFEGLLPAIDLKLRQGP